MIIRELKANPSEVPASFDWFNDYKDTRSWARSACPEAIPALDAGYDKWLSEWGKSLRPKPRRLT